jgi:hypothetical protein
MRRVVLLWGLVSDVYTHVLCELLQLMGHVHAFKVLFALLLDCV